ncbi:MAG: hypothetical protein D6701_14525 [Gemmatimonadetes bacterium]|nr:MAG: hypothetical protein D6701_14525 [Gemmatimonadota bacterium]
MSKRDWILVGVVLGAGVLLQIPRHDHDGHGHGDHEHGAAPHAALHGETGAGAHADLPAGARELTLAVTGMT